MTDNNLKVTSIELTFPQNLNSKLKCYAKIIINDVILINGIRLFEDKSDPDNIKRFIRFPDHTPPLSQTKGQYISIAIVNVLDPEYRLELRDILFEAYDKHYKNPANRKKEI